MLTSPKANTGMPHKVGDPMRAPVCIYAFIRL